MKNTAHLRRFGHQIIVRVSTLTPALRAEIEKNTETVTSAGFTIVKKTLNNDRVIFTARLNEGFKWDSATSKNPVAVRR